jgi:Icc-related predicted phosphoesterase
MITKIALTNQVIIRVYEVVGNGLCVASDDGQKVHDQITRTFREGKKILLSFQNVEMLTPTFLNAAIGQLYGEFPEAQIKANLSVTEMESDDLELLKRVVDTAKDYFRDHQRH